MPKEEHSHKEEHKGHSAPHTNQPGHAAHQGQAGHPSHPAPHEAPGQHSVIQRFKKQPVLLGILAFLLIGGAVGGLAYYAVTLQRVYIEKAEINAPIISVTPTTAGVLQKVYVQEGDYVGTSRKLALINGVVLRATTPGLIVGVYNAPGQIVSPQAPVIKMIDPTQLRVVGHLDEDKGLEYVRVGQRVIFTADAFGSKQYVGVVDSIAQTARAQDIVFTISSQRQVNQFDVSAVFDSSVYPELKNGMSAKMWVYK